MLLEQWIVDCLCAIEHEPGSIGVVIEKTDGAVLGGWQAHADADAIAQLDADIHKAFIDACRSGVGEVALVIRPQGCGVYEIFEGYPTKGGDA